MKSMNEEISKLKERQSSSINLQEHLKLLNTQFMNSTKLNSISFRQNLVNAAARQ